jgi:translation elongation factor EF-G
MSILEKYIDDVLIPTDHQIKFIKSRVKSIRKVLMSNSSLKPKEVHLGGSFEKGTMLKYKFDIDIICIYNKCDEIGKNWQKLVDTVYKPLKNNFPDVEVEEAGNLAIHIKTLLENQTVNFDIVPCYYVSSPKMMHEHIDSKLYSGITSIWHSRYLARYKDLQYFTDVVRLLKDWKKEHDIPLKSIHLELIAADTYDNVIENIDNYEIDDVLMDCFENILNTLEGYTVIPFNWKYCNEEKYEERYNSPTLIDPANLDDNLLMDLTVNKIKNIWWKVNITMENLKNENYEEIFNWKGLTEFNFEQ